jgi:hypothetical protein
MLLIVTFRFGSSFAVWEWTFLSLPSQNIKRRHSTGALGKKQFFSPPLLLLYSFMRFYISALKVGDVLVYGADFYFFLNYHGAMTIQRLKNKLNFKSSIAIICMVINAFTARVN